MRNGKENRFVLLHYSNWLFKFVQSSESIDLIAYNRSSFVVYHYSPRSYRYSIATKKAKV